MEIEKLMKKCMGLTYENAEILCKKEGFTIRKTQVDCRCLMVTQDIRTDRISVSTINNIITSCKQQ